MFNWGDLAQPTPQLSGPYDLIRTINLYEYPEEWIFGMFLAVSVRNRARRLQHVRDVAPPPPHPRKTSSRLRRYESSITHVKSIVRIDYNQVAQLCSLCLSKRYRLNLTG